MSIPDDPWEQDITDMRALYDAAYVLERRSRKPNSAAIRIFTKVLTDTAHKISEGKLPVLRTLKDSVCKDVPPP